MRIGSLFTGYGGLDMAVSAVFAAETVWTSDIDNGACKIIAHRYPEAPNLGDITKIDWAEVDPVDIVTGGFPCQDVSFAGKLAGIRPGTRSGLWGEFARCIAWLRPKYIVIENVIGLMSGEWIDEPNDRCVCGWAYRRGGVYLDFDQAQPVGDCLLGGSLGWYDRPSKVSSGVSEESIRWLRGTSSEADESMGISFEVVNSWHGGGAIPEQHQGPFDSERGTGPDSSVGRRDQVSIACAEEWQCILDRSGKITLCSADEAATRVECERTEDSTSVRLLCPSCGRNLGDRSTRNVFRSGISVILRDLASLGYLGSWRCLRASDVGAPHRRSRIFIVAADADSFGRESFQEFDRQPSWEVRGAFGEDLDRRSCAEGKSLTCSDAFGDYSSAVRNWELILGRPAPSPTERSPKGNLRLSPKFTEWMMGLPEGWVTDVPGLGYKDKSRALGNGVVPQQAFAALNSVVIPE